ncbi:hypothetical protein DICVIV_08396 [Dictyocaulus viviparus]|uniref:Thioredoxin-like fold domain-containing protein n=1 Tax=Dictyocaulus viviparus TaxID=29172 RepID=A0A0D8XP33_DICVI|nr:hypothetical protein DICVIV_08396 [Dictyocaulus viviparus]
MSVGVLFELGIESKTISHYVKGSAFDMVLVVVVRSFTSTTVAQHIMGLYNRIPEFRKLGCDVCVLTKGPPVGTRGGSYIKLIGVPFRRLYDENEALNELKFHRRSTIDLVGWEALLRTVDASLAEEPRPHSSSKITSNSPHEDQDYFITQKGGTILVDRSGNVLFKYIESEDVPWPTVDDVLDQVRKANESSPPKVSGAVKIDSEISAKEKKHDKQQTSCCVVM